jgi:predicted N-formylglutamate amidohydrolase
MTGRLSADALALVVSCEHGGNDVPAAYRRLFTGPATQAALHSHRGWDRGSLQIGRWFARRLQAPLIVSTTTRLLVEPNRSIGHRRIFSEWTQSLPDEQKQSLLDHYYHPHREKVVAAITAAHADAGSVLHLSMHTFTPVFDGVTRTTDVGLLFDPARSPEADLCRQWQQQLRRHLPDLTIHRNRPYRGTSDGLTTALRRQFPPERYLGIELEVNQRFFAADVPTLSTRTLLEGLVTSLQQLLSSEREERPTGGA